MQPQTRPSAQTLDEQWRANQQQVALQFQRFEPHLQMHIPPHIASTLQPVSREPAKAPHTSIDLPRLDYQTPASGRYRTRITTLTWCMWPVRQDLERRWAAIEQVIQQHQPDLVALQNLSTRLYQLLLRSALVQRYNLSHNWKHGALLLSRLPLSQVRVVPICGGATVTCAEMSVPTQDTGNGQRGPARTLRICSTQLTKGIEAFPLRAQQLAECQRQCEQATDAILLGNFETVHPRESYETIGKLTDLWYRDRTGFTYDWVENSTVQERYRSRVDRIYLQSDAKVQRHMELVGTRPLNHRVPLWPAQHFGLLCVLELEFPPNQPARSKRQDHGLRLAFRPD